MLSGLYTTNEHSVYNVGMELLKKFGVAAVLAFLFVVFQVQLWFGRGSLPEVWGMRAQLSSLDSANAKAKLDNAQLLAEVRDLTDGLEMVEERARFELGMVKPNEIFVQTGASKQP